MSRTVTGYRAEGRPTREVYPTEKKFGSPAERGMAGEFVGRRLGVTGLRAGNNQEKKEKSRKKEKKQML